MQSTEDLDADISDLHARISTLQAQRANLSSILLSSTHIQQPLHERPANNEGQRKKAANTAKKQANRNIENVHRACAGVTAYKVKDPDPNAVDSGNILGVRIEVFVGTLFMETYHVLFNRPNPRHKLMLKVHRHTIPPCIPLRSLVEKWLPQSQKDITAMVEQDLVNFGRVLRKELVSWHLRTAALEKLRKEAGVSENNVERRPKVKEPTFGKVLNAFVSDDEDEDEEDSEHEAINGQSTKIMNIDTDLAVRELSFVWSNRQTGIVTLTKDGQVQGAVFRTGDGVRLSQLERKAVGHIEGLVQRLSA